MQRNRTRKEANTKSGILRRLLSEEDAAKNGKMVKATDEELDAVSGGAIVEVNGSYWAYSDGPNDDGIVTFNAVGFWDKNKAIEAAERQGWSTTSMTVEEFKKKYGITDFDDPTTWRPVV